MLNQNNKYNKDSKDNNFIYLKQFTIADYFNIIKKQMIIKSDCELFPNFIFTGYIDSVRPASNNTGTYIIYFKYKQNNNNINNNNHIIYKTIKIDSSMYKLRYKLL